MTPLSKTRVGKRLIGWDEVNQQCGGLSRTEAWRMRKAGLFPEPVKIGRRRVAWIAEEIDEWVQRQIDGASN